MRRCEDLLIAVFVTVLFAGVFIITMWMVAEVVQ